MEILYINKLIFKKIITSNNKSQVFFKLKDFDYQHNINFKISLNISTCFEFENNLFKIEKSIHSINSVIHADVPLQEKPILNLDALLLEDSIEYKVNKSYLEITKSVIKERLSTVGRN
jgi:hypothetical protein